MAARLGTRVTATAVVCVASLTYAARAAAFLDVGGDAILADLLANATRQLATAAQALSELRRARAELEHLRQDADDTAEADRSFGRSAARLAGGTFQAALDAARTDPDGLRRDALAASSATAGTWARAVDPLEPPSRYCLAGVEGGESCVETGHALDGAGVVLALRSVFGLGLAVEQTRVVDAEAAVAIEADAAQSTAARLARLRLRDLLERCRAGGDTAGSREARQVAEECRLAAAEAQLFGLEQAVEANARLALIGRLEALSAEQRNAELRRRLAQDEAHRAALTAGLETLVGQRVGIRPGGATPGQ